MKKLILHILKICTEGRRLKMYFNSDLVIRRNKEYFKKLNELLKIDYIDSYMIGGLLGYKYKRTVEMFDEKEDDQNDISIPRSVLNKRMRKLEFLWSLVYLLEHQDKEKDMEYFNKVFESNDDSSSSQVTSFMSIDRVRLFHKYALGGVEYLFEKIVDRSINEYLDYEICIDELIKGIEDYGEDNIFDRFVIH